MREEQIITGHVDISKLNVTHCIPNYYDPVVRKQQRNLFSLVFNLFTCQAQVRQEILSVRRCGD